MGVPVQKPAPGLLFSLYRHLHCEIFDLKVDANLNCLREAQGGRGLGSGQAEQAGADQGLAPEVRVVLRYAFLCLDVCV